MKISRNHDPGSNQYRISFTFDITELMEFNLEDTFGRLWRGSRSEKEYVEFIVQLSRRAEQKRTRDQYTSQYDDLFRAAKEKVRQDQARRQQARGYYEPFRPQDFAGSGYNYGFDMGHDSTPDPTWCKTLGLPKTATKADIKAKYRQLVKVHHPDAGGDPIKFKEVTQAYEEAMK